ncbi:hypothetical protein K438DRAFT_1947424 [Mycena galopus ATCC 62051]|nr:hypothetical protein K438DRAFT_1947424 [Mycena galopus ATCC 62051]
MADPQSKRGAQRLVQADENVVYWFINDKDGNPVTGRRAKSMRDEARWIWNSLGKNGHTPKRWGDADSVLCELNYKSHHITINIYPAWHAKFVEETPAPAPKRSASEAPESKPAKKKYRGRKKANQSGSADGPLPPADPASAPSTSAVPILTLALSASSSAPPPVSAPAPVSIAPSPSVISAGPILQLPPPAVPLLSTASQSITLLSPINLSAALTKNLPIQMEMDSNNPLVPTSDLSMSTPAATAAGPSMSTPVAKAAGPSTSKPAAAAVGAGPAVTAVNNPLVFLGDSTAPTTRADFIADVAKPSQEQEGHEVRQGKISPPKQDQVGEASAYCLAEDCADALLDRNLCLIDYIEKKEIPLPGKVQSDVFDRYYSGLTKEEMKVWADKSKHKKSTKRRMHE